ncbi:MAG: Dabb family protein [Lewinellaceae bacterium]|nr:Dabb family protein [Lewinellaceae bacterium]
MKNQILLLIPLFVLSACRQQVDTHLQEELSQARIRLQEVETELEGLKAGPEKGQLVHIVFLHLKEGLSEEETAVFISQLKQLGGIGLAKGLEIGKVADTGDQRFISDHDIAFQMTFASMEDYKAYMEHPAHLAIRESLKPYLGGPPAVYDYWIE